MARGSGLIEGRWRIVETDVWDQEALDLVAPAHITFGPDGLGDMQLIAIGASIDYRVKQGSSLPMVRFSWSGFDEMDPACGRGWAKVEGDVMRGKLFIHQGDESRFVAKRDREGRISRTSAPRQPTAAGRGRGAQTRPRGRRGRG